jgi:hypothetical protein
MVEIPCLCPPKATGEPRHDHDTVTLRAKLDFHGVTAASYAVQILKFEDPEASAAEVLATLTEHYMLMGIESWSLVDIKGKPVEVTKPAIRELLLTNIDAASKVGDAADEMYAAAVMLPLLQRASTSSPRTPEAPSTSAPTALSDKRPKPSKRSSTSTTRTAATVTTSASPAGDSRSSPNSATAA